MVKAYHVHVGGRGGAFMQVEMKDVESGISSLYREVQGLSTDESQYEKKKGLMDDIFQANMALQQGARA